MQGGKENGATPAKGRPVSHSGGPDQHTRHTPVQANLDMQCCVEGALSQARVCIGLRLRGLSGPCDTPVIYGQLIDPSARPPSREGTSRT